MDHLTLIMYMDEALLVAMVEQQALQALDYLGLLILCMIKMPIMLEMVAKPQSLAALAAKI